MKQLMMHPRVTVVVATACAVMVACGGGNPSIGGGGAPAATYSSGRITGFGSIVINKVHYDEKKAIIRDEDGAAHNQDELKLGMVVEVHAGDIGQSNNQQTAAAQNITFSSLVNGPIESIAADKLSVVVLGQTVKVNATTVFDDALAGGAKALAAGMVVRVYGTTDAAGIGVASRIEPQTGAQSYRLRGSVASYDKSKNRLTIGAAVIDVSSVSMPEVRPGSLVRVKLQTTKAADGSWVATGVKLGLFEPQENDHTEVEGNISDFSSAQGFVVDGLAVDASKAVFEGGANALAKGVRVEVEGAIVNGILVATKVELKSEDKDQQEGFNVDGSISTLSAGGSTFVVHGVTVKVDSSTKFVGDAASDLKAGAHVVVQGTLAADGTTLIAAEIKVVR